jgi:hypothetical protein
MDITKHVGATYNSYDKAYTITEGVIQSLSETLEVSPTIVHTFFRSTHMNANIDFFFEISRDGGTNWAYTPIQKLRLSGDDIEIYSGDCMFDSTNASKSLVPSDFSITDDKGSITQFIVDTPFTSGHFDTAAVGIEEGSFMTISEIGTVIITGIDGDGTVENSVTYTSDGI